MEAYEAFEGRYSGMRYERCGDSGVLLPRVSLGFWHGFGEDTPFEVSRELALTAFDNGVTHFDLANNYGPEPGAAELRLGRLLREDLGRHRDELFISTKAAYDMWDGPYGSWAGRKHLMASIDQSLRRMGVEYVDLFYCHRHDPCTPLEETLQALVDIARGGKALHIGLSRWPLAALRRGMEYLAERDVPLLAFQGRLNILDRDVEGEGILDELRLCGKGFIGFSPLAQGLLTDRYLDGIPGDSRMARGRFLRSSVLTQDLLSRLRRLDGMARGRGESLARMSLAWALQRRGVTSVLVGASRRSQLLDDISAIHSAPLSAEELALIDGIAGTAGVPGTRPSAAPGPCQG